MTISSINIPTIGGTTHVTVLDLDFSTPVSLPPSGVNWTSSPNASGQVSVITDQTGFVFTGMAAGSWTFTATYTPGGAHAALVVTVGPTPSAIGFSSP